MENKFCGMDFYSSINNLKRSVHRSHLFALLSCETNKFWIIKLENKNGITFLSCTKRIFYQELIFFSVSACADLKAIRSKSTFEKKS